jgi:hypothetical protein
MSLRSWLFLILIAWILLVSAILTLALLRSPDPHRLATEWLSNPVLTFARLLLYFGVFLAPILAFIGLVRILIWVVVNLVLISSTDLSPCSSSVARL